MEFFINILKIFINKNPLTKKLSYKLSFIYLVVITLPVVMYAITSYYLSAVAVEHDYVEYRNSMNMQLLKNVEDNISMLTRQSASVFMNLEDISFIINTPPVYLEDNYFEAQKRVKSYLLSILDYNTMIDGIALIGIDGNLVDYVSRSAGNSNLVSVKNDEWFKNTVKLKGAPFFIEPHENKFVFLQDASRPDQYVISIARALQHSTSSNNPAGVMVFDQKISNMDTLLERYKLTEEESVYFLGVSGNLIFCRGNTLSDMDHIINRLQNSGNKSSFRFEHNNRKFLASYSSSKELGWKVISVIPVKQLQLKSEFLKNIAIILLSILIFFIFLISIIVANFIVAPLRRLKCSFKELEKGNFNISLPVEGRDELADISKSFNVMVNNVKLLVQQKYEANILKKQAELESLQSQINPHFLFNTLNSIKSVSDSYDNDKTSNMVMDLSDLFRYSLNRGKHTVIFREELENIKKYLSLQAFRFEDKFNVVFDIDEEVLEYETVRLTLQPIVENAIRHGLEPKVGKGMISLMAKRAGDQFIIFISDNGTGISHEQLKYINSLLENDFDTGLKNHPDKLGLYNVNARIKLHFGNEYGLRIYSNNNNTTIKILLPIKVKV